MAVDTVMRGDNGTQGTVIVEALVAIGLAAMVFALVGTTVQVVARHTERAVTAAERSAPFLLAARIASLYRRIDPPWWAAPTQGCTVAYLDGDIDATITIASEDGALAVTISDADTDDRRARFAAPGAVTCTPSGGFAAVQLAGVTVRARAGVVPPTVDDSRPR